MRTREEIETQFSTTESLKGIRDYVLIGIGGAGMSGIARILAHQGYSVRGTDAQDSHVIAGLRAVGIDVMIGHQSIADLTEKSAVVVSDAIDLATSPEVASARASGALLVRRSQVLGWVLRDYRVIAITGSHGKTTTTTLTGMALEAAGFDPTVIVGAEVRDYGGSVRIGSSDWAVVEACEAYDTLRDINPAHVLLTNLEHEHVDFHPTFGALIETVVMMCDRLPSEGRLFFTSDDPGARVVAEATVAKSVPVELSEELPVLSLPGEHNRANASLARRVATYIGANPESVDAALTACRGAERRQEVRYDAGDLTLIDDYAHHPTEISATLRALRVAYPGRRMVVVFQPHLYSRTEPLIDEFAKTLSAADELIITDIYPARERPLPGVSSVRIAELATVPTTYIPSRHLLPRVVNRMVQVGDLVVTMGAGNISEFPSAFLAERQRQLGRFIAVFGGGDSAEREVSRLSALSVADSLQKQGYLTRVIDPTERLLTGDGFSDLIGSNRPDLVFLCLHGTHAEDGAVQGLLDLLHIPYTGSSLAVSVVAMNKEKTKTVLASNGIDVPCGRILKKGEGANELRELEGERFVVKPNRQGSTVGLSFVESRASLPHALDRAFAYDDEALVEEWVEGTEISVPVLGDEVLPAVEIVPASGRYDFSSKYLPGATDEICPARLDETTTRRAQALALKCHQALGCEGLTRTDMIVHGDRIVVLEINTLPGMTPTSLVPRAAREHGWSFDTLVKRVAEEAILRAR
ncbi:MAG: D-alanine--D-alanine ligase [Fimbriimonadaceae bacterium]|nr:D-alanine--D-alanine ligase [Fimbriimonadaceae bacterium]